ncbi:hypothetical protein BJ944DRAFT_103076, partial [Cunninghamella echinulata]
MESSDLWDVSEHPLANAVLWEKPIEDINKTEFRILYMGRASSTAKSKVRQAIAPALIKLQKSNQQLEQRKRMAHQRLSNTTSSPMERLKPQVYHLYNKGLQDEAIAYKDNCMNLLEYDGTWDLLTIHATEHIVYDEIFIPQNLYTELLPRSIKLSIKQKSLFTSLYDSPSTIDLIVYFYEGHLGPVDQDLKFLRKLSISVLPLLISPSSSLKTLSPPLTETEFTLNDNENDDHIIFSPSLTQFHNKMDNNSAEYLNDLKLAFSSHLQRYHIHCLDMASITPEIPPFLSSSSLSSCRHNGIYYPSSLCYTPTSQEIIHVDQFSTLNCENMYGLLTKLEYNNITYIDIIKRKQRKRLGVIIWITGLLIFLLIIIYFDVYHLYEHLDYLSNNKLSSFFNSLLLIVIDVLVFILSVLSMITEALISTLPLPSSTIVSPPPSFISSPSSSVTTIVTTAAQLSHPTSRPLSTSVSHSLPLSSFSHPPPPLQPTSLSILSSSNTSSSLPSIVPSIIHILFYRV